MRDSDDTRDFISEIVSEEIWVDIDKTICFSIVYWRAIYSPINNEVKKKLS